MFSFQVCDGNTTISKDSAKTLSTQQQKLSSISPLARRWSRRLNWCGSSRRRIPEAVEAVRRGRSPPTHYHQSDPTPDSKCSPKTTQTANIAQHRAGVKSHTRQRWGSRWQRHRAPEDRRCWIVNSLRQVRQVRGNSDRWRSIQHLPGLRQHTKQWHRGDPVLVTACKILRPKTNSN